MDFFCTFAYMNIQEYNKLLKDNIKDIDKKLKDYIYLKGGILRAVKLRLYRGIDGSGSSLGTYAPGTIEMKKKGRDGRDTKTSNVTLRDTGKWYKSLFLRWEGVNLLLDSTDPSKTQLLIEGEKKMAGYGDDILELSQDEVVMADTITEKFMEELVSKINKIDIKQEI